MNVVRFHNRQIAVTRETVLILREGGRDSNNIKEYDMGLILTRREHQSVRIGDDIVVRVVAINGKQVELEFVAPKSVRILRDELDEHELSDWGWNKVSRLKPESSYDNENL